MNKHSKFCFRCGRKEKDTKDENWAGVYIVNLSETRADGNKCIVVCPKCADEAYYELNKTLHFAIDCGFIKPKLHPNTKKLEYALTDYEKLMELVKQQNTAETIEQPKKPLLLRLYNYITGKEDAK